jgi:hypothetical protein
MHPDGNAHSPSGRFFWIFSKKLTRGSKFHPDQQHSNKNPHPKGWGYTDKARLRGLKMTFELRI